MVYQCTNLATKRTCCHTSKATHRIHDKPENKSNHVTCGLKPITSKHRVTASNRSLPAAALQLSADVGQRYLQLIIPTFTDAISGHFFRPARIGFFLAYGAASYSSKTCLFVHFL